MKAISELYFEAHAFIAAFYHYAHKRLHQAGALFEKYKDSLVTILIAKRGLYQRPFLHASLFVLVTIAVLAFPLIVNKNLSQASDDLAQINPPSAVLSSFDDQDTFTQISEKPRDKVITYEVENGDTISTIAEKFGISTDTIKWANQTKISGDNLKIGQEIDIPPVAGVVHKVQKGETIYSVAKKYKVDAQNIVNYPFNDFADLDTFALNTGQLLIVPDGVMPESKPVYIPRTIADAGSVQSAGQFMWPTQGVITQRPISYHMAFDIANNALPAIMAADTGVVSSVTSEKYGYGQHILITHSNGYQTLYAHMSEMYVQAGQAVSKGSVIGKMGSSGRSTGPHLHFEIRQNGKLLNPANFFAK